MDYKTQCLEQVHLALFELTRCRSDANTIRHAAMCLAHAAELALAIPAVECGSDAWERTALGQILAQDAGYAGTFPDGGSGSISREEAMARHEAAITNGV